MRKLTYVVAACFVLPALPMVALALLPLSMRRVLPHVRKEAP